MAQRTKRIIPIIEKSRRALLLTGTALESRPKELYNQIDGLRPSLFNNFFEFADRYCDP